MRVSKLDHHNQQQAIQIWKLFHSAYEIEAQVLGLENFPPLNRTIREIQLAETTFFGNSLNSTLVAAAEIEDCAPGHFHINSFGVYPDHFRQGHGSTLLIGILHELDWQQVSVSTAVANTPALALYQIQGFQLQEEWMTPDNIHMVTLYKETKF